MIANAFPRNRFKALISFTYGPDQGCGGKIDLRSANSATIRSLDADSDGNYEDNLICTWVAKGRDAKNIKLSFSSFDVEREDNGTASICWDFVEVS